MDVTPCIFCRNEEYWIYYVLRGLLKEFPTVIMLDTGSTDNTKKIAKQTAKLMNGSLRLLEEQFGNDPRLIGNSTNILRKECSTEWMLLVGGDEIWLSGQLKQLKSLIPSIPDNIEVCMLLGRNIRYVDGKLNECDGFNADRLFRPSVQWYHTKYPYEDHGLANRIARGSVSYLEPWFWHVRALDRSSKDRSTYYRAQKQGFFKYNWLKPVPDDWLSGTVHYPNPYIRESIYA